MNLPTRYCGALPLEPPTDNPMVVCVMLANGRREMVHRALRSFLSQTYKRKRLVIWNTGDDATLGIPEYLLEIGLVAMPTVSKEGRSKTIGALRNWANRYALDHYVLNADRPQVIAHWDSDDWSDRQRLTEQVAHLVGSWPRPCVGYNKMLFWDVTKAGLQRRRDPVPYEDGDLATVIPVAGEAWLYANDNPAQPLGTSLMYWREAWEANNFQPCEPSTGAEDVRFLDTLKPFATSVSSVRPDGPRMIAAIHGANTSTRIQECKEWVRVPEYDETCREIMS